MRVVFFHAHPDDEAIFTGGTMRLLADRDVEVVLVVGTRGERGLAVDGAAALADHRAAETKAAAHVLGVAAVHFLGYDDSGLAVDPAHADAFAHADVDEAARRAIAAVRVQQGDAVVTYDGNGIYAHPDHVQMHRVGRRTAELAGVATVYEVTVDREYLHFVESHLVEEAGQALNLPVGPLDGSDAPFEPHLGEGEPGTLGLASSEVGLPSVLIDCTVDVRRVIEVKRAAMAAHASQIPTDSSAWRLSPDAFAEVYGYEWFTRSGPAGPIDDLGW